MKKSLAIFLATTLAVSALAGCASSSNKTESTTSTTSETTKKEQLVFVNYRDIRDLNPHLYAGEMYAQNMIYDGLVDMVDGGFEGALAESWEISEDAMTYTFHIRKGVTFSDGTVCDANAIKANFDALFENAERHSWQTIMGVMDSYYVTDDYTFVMQLKTPSHQILTELSLVRPFAIISPASMINGSTKDGVSSYVGTGAYILSEFVTDEYARFVRNENYWGKMPEIPEILVKVIPDNQTRIMALEKGEIDLIFGKNMIDADVLQTYQNSDKFTVSISEPTSTRQIVLNTTNDILNDKAVRHAISYATNKQAISDGIFSGIEPVAETLYATNIPYCDITLEPYTYNIEKASEILAKAGWTMSANGILEKDGQSLELELLYNSDSVTEKTISEFLQSEYLKIGIKLNIHGEEEQSYRDRMKAGNFEMVFNICWGTPYDPESSVSGMTAPVYGDYAAQLGLENKAELDEAIKRIMVTIDQEERQELYTYILTTLHEEAVYLPLTYECNKALYTTALDGVGFTQSQYEIPFLDMYFK